MRGRKGFTLIEMLIVITIIVLLLALLAILIKGVQERARYAKTKSLVDALDKACAAYKLDFGIYPPNNKGDSRCLHFYLGRDRYIEAQKISSGTAPKVKRPAYIEFRGDQLQTTSTAPPNPDTPNPIMDAWGNDIMYLCYTVGGATLTYNKNGVEIWSKGRNGIEEKDPKSATFDDVTNWTRDY